MNNDIDIDTSILIDSRQELSQIRNQFGDINIQMIKMISTAKNTLEGNQMDLAEKTTFESINQIKNTVSSIDEIIRFLNELNVILDEYFSYKFSEE